MWVEHGLVATLRAERNRDTRAVFYAAAHRATIRPGDLGFECDADDWQAVAMRRVGASWVFVFARPGASEAEIGALLLTAGADSE